MKKTPKKTVRPLVLLFMILALLLCAAQGEGTDAKLTISSPEDAESFGRGGIRGISVESRPSPTYSP